MVSKGLPEIGVYHEVCLSCLKVDSSGFQDIRSCYEVLNEDIYIYYGTGDISGSTVRLEKFYFLRKQNTCCGFSTYLDAFNMIVHKNKKCIRV